MASINKKTKKTSSTREKNPQKSSVDKEKNRVISTKRVEMAKAIMNQFDKSMEISEALMACGLVVASMLTDLQEKPPKLKLFEVFKILNDFNIYVTQHLMLHFEANHNISKKGKVIHKKTP